MRYSAVPSRVGLSVRQLSRSDMSWIFIESKLTFQIFSGQEDGPDMLVFNQLPYLWSDSISFEAHLGQYELMSHKAELVYLP